MDIVWIKLMKPLPEVLGFKGEVPFCIVGEEPDENDTIEDLMRRLAARHPDFAEVAFMSTPGGKDFPTIMVKRNGHISSLQAFVGSGDMVTVSMGGGC